MLSWHSFLDTLPSALQQWRRVSSVNPLNSAVMNNSNYCCVIVSYLQFTLYMSEKVIDVISCSLAGMG